VDGVEGFEPKEEVRYQRSRISRMTTSAEGANAGRKVDE